MIIGIGVDVVDLARFERAGRRTPALLDRLFAESERSSNGRQLASHSLAARFAAKEALIKAIGDSTGMRWHDMRVTADANGNPSFVTSGGIADIMAARGITRLHLSMSHDGGVAIAYVIAEAAA